MKLKLSFFPPGEFLRDLVALESGGSGGVVWRIRANQTKLVCAVGSRNGTEETKLLVLDFDVAPGSGYGFKSGGGATEIELEEEIEEEEEDGSVSSGAMLPMQQEEEFPTVADTL